MLVPCLQGLRLNTSSASSWTTWNLKFGISFLQFVTSGTT